MKFLGFRVGGHDLAVTRRLWRLLEGPKPAEGFKCDGCSWSPDSWAGYKLWPACVIHDYHYRTADLRGVPGGGVPGTAAGRAYADATFRRNLVTLLREQGCGPVRSQRVAWIYWGRVRIWGASAFQHWSAGEKPASRWQRIREVWG